MLVRQILGSADDYDVDGACESGGVEVLVVLVWRTDRADRAAEVVHGARRRRRGREWEGWGSVTRREVGWGPVWSPAPAISALSADVSRHVIFRDMDPGGSTTSHPQEIDVRHDNIALRGVRRGSDVRVEREVRVEGGQVAVVA